MYPFVRFAFQMWRHRKDPPLGLFGTHVSRHLCWPWDLDLWVELNNGRTLTLFDLGRLPMSRRMGLIAVLRRNGWGMTVAGSTTRYRARIRAFERIVMKSRVIGWDARFVYAEQAMFLRDGRCANHVLIRSAVTGPDGIVPPERLLAAMGLAPRAPHLPDWARAWTEAEAARPWPPMPDA